MIQGGAAYAVWGFYVLSGFLMTLVIKDKYGFTVEGILKYISNRIIRIFPLYYICLLAGIATIVFLRHHKIDPTQFNGQFYMPSRGTWLAPLTLLTVFPTTGLPVATSGALATEFTAYAMMPLMAFSPLFSLLFFFISLVVNISYGFGLESFAARYTFFSTCLIAFSFGSLLCHFKPWLSLIRNRPLSLGAWLLLSVSWLRYPYFPWEHGLYVSLPVSGWVVLSFIDVRKNKLDGLLGDLSYPVYLAHTLVLAWYFVVFHKAFDLRCAVEVYVFSVILSYILIVVVDRPLSRLKVRGRTTAPDNQNYDLTLRARSRPKISLI